ncbi:MAG: phosphoenolpyruvate--protein phosphotransferase [Bryobacteraceae bacterium]
MIGLVIVSHSARLAEGVCELAAGVAQGQVRLAHAGGTSDPQNPFGTDAFKVAGAIESVYSEDGVLVLMDLGSAVLSAETALELLAEEKRPRVRLCAAPLVEGAVAAAAQAAAGASLDEVFREAQSAQLAKATHLTAPGQADARPSSERSVTLVNPLGLHARPAAQFVRMARRYRARVLVENTTHQAGPSDAGSIGAVLGLGARRQHVLRLRAEGPEASEALDALAAFVESGCGEGGEPAAAEPRPSRPQEGDLSGIAASAGIAIGPLVRLRPVPVPASEDRAGDPKAEWERLAGAIEAARKETEALYQWARTKAGDSEAGIFDAQLLFLDDPELAAEASRAISSDGCRAEEAWQSASQKMSARLAALDDPYLRARAADVADVAARVLGKLAGEAAGPPEFSEPSILAAHDLTPSQVRDLEAARILGLCLESGSASAHGVILARALGIPAVVGLGPALAAIPEGTVVALDGEQGAVWISPGPDRIRLLQERRDEWLSARREAEQGRKRPAATRDGRRIRVVANISGVPEAAQAVEHGAEGVGVLRTEFLFLGRKEAPGEEEQFVAYRTIADALGGRPLVIRTLDIGGDKNLPFIELGPEDNPFLGWRGIRLALGRPDLLRTQIRAILRAGADRPVSLLLPMVSTIDELRQARVAVERARRELEREGAEFRRQMPVGVMIEVPAAVTIADQLAREADLFSIGTNDLIQYTMAADRTNSRVASLADPFQPAVLRLISQTVQAGRKAGIEVALCGELAADPLATGLLIGMGLEELSVSAALIPEVKCAIAQWTMPEAEALAREALSQETSAAVRKLLAARRFVFRSEGS